ncbi:RNA polymerase subunit sigma [Bordetella genomosp. 10]|uniref:RNA polymerase subunit sigma n=1 Tax=Bordetella genomosp. 10 TaxID=1416804 RepID=A0A261S5R8_9BORD|nr:RNA polymerase subunit sigma [Bordetella genomosp. 10]
MDPEGAHSLYADHHAWLYGWLRRKVGCAAAAADLAHDSYVRLLAARRMPAPDQSRAYLMQIAKGLVIDQSRRREIEAAFLETLSVLPEELWPSPESRAIVLETLEKIDAVLYALPSKVRETFLLSRFDGLTYAEIAARLHVSVASVRKYMVKAVYACLPLVAE